MKFRPDASGGKLGFSYTEKIDEHGSSIQLSVTTNQTDQRIAFTFTKYVSFEWVKKIFRKTDHEDTK